MFVRLKRSGSPGAIREYLQIVESFREQGKVRQRLIATLGRRDELVATGALDDLIRSLTKFSAQVRVVERVRHDGLQAHTARAWGPALVFGRLWEQQGLPEIFARLAHGRRFGFDLERAGFALALQRLCAPGSDLQGVGWLRTVECPGVDALALQHLYRTVGGFLAAGRADLERELFFRDRDLFAQTLDLVFIDTTSTFVWRTEESALRRRGYSRDRRPDQPQVVICLAVDRHGWPIAWDILPGNTDDRTAFTQMIATLRTRFQIGRVIVVADRGMISQKVLALLTGDARAPFDYILGCRLRQDTGISATSSAATWMKRRRMPPPAPPSWPSSSTRSRTPGRRPSSATSASSASSPWPRAVSPSTARPWSGTRGSTASSSCGPPPR